MIMRPEPWEVHDVSAFFFCALDPLGRPAQALPREALLGNSAVMGVSTKPGFDGEYVYAGIVQAVTQSLSKEAYRAFGRAINVVALAATIASH